MTPEEHVAHAAAVKLMEDKDYFVMIYNTILGKLMDHAGIAPNSDGTGFKAAVTVPKIIPLAELLAKQAMEPIINYGKTEK